MDSNENFKAVPILQRFFIFLVDLAVVLVVFLFVSGAADPFSIGRLSGYFLGGVIVGGILAILKSLLLIFTSATPFSSNEEVINLLGLLLYYLYFFISELIFKTTIGKHIFRAKLVSVERGTTPSNYQILIRSLCRMIPFDPFSFISKTPHGWHDSIPKINVVRKANPSNNKKESHNSTFEKLINKDNESRWNKIGNILLYALMVIVMIFTVYGVFTILN